MKPQYIEIDEDGKKRFYSDRHMTILHREDGPAVEYADGGKEWLVDGKYHRLDGPAYDYAEGGKAWYVDGKLHRLDGPAIEYADGGKEWLVDGKYHRLDGPAIESANGKEAWCINGESISEDEFFKRTDWREDQHIVDLRYLRDVLSIDSIELETASELLKTNLLKIAISIIDEMHDDAMKEKRANGFLG
jgi:hypothetical protein